MTATESFGFFPYGQRPARTPPSHQNELYAMGPSPFAEAGWSFKDPELKPVCASPEARPRTARRSSIGIASPFAAAVAPSARSSVASYYSASTVAPSDVDLSRALNVVHSMVSLPGSTARNSLDLPSGAATAGCGPQDLYSPSRASICMSPRCTTPGGNGGTGGGGRVRHRSSMPGLSPPPLLPAAPATPVAGRPGTRNGRPVTVTGIASAAGLGVRIGTGPGLASESGASRAVAEERERISAAGTAERQATHRVSIDAAAGAEELASRLASSTGQAATVPIYRPTAPKPSPLREALRTATGAEAAGAAALQQQHPGLPVGSVVRSSGGGGAADDATGSSASTLMRASTTQAWGAVDDVGDEWSFGGNLQRARIKARYAAIDVAGELRYEPPPPSASGGSRGGDRETRSARKAWKLFTSFASRAIGGGVGGGKYKPAPAAPPGSAAAAAGGSRPKPRPSMADEPPPVQRSRDSRRMLLVQRVRTGLDGEPAALPPSQKRAAGPAAAALAAAKKAAPLPSEERHSQRTAAAATAEPPPPPARAGSVGVKKLGGRGCGGEGAEDLADELDAAMLAAAAAFAAATESELSRQISLA